MDFYGAKGPFVAGVGQYQHCPHGLGVGGAETWAGKGQVLSEEGGKYVSSSCLLQPVPLGATRQSKERGPAYPVPPIAAPPRQLPASAPAIITSTVQTQTQRTAPAPVREPLRSASPGLSFLESLCQ